MPVKVIAGCRAIARAPTAIAGARTARPCRPEVCTTYWPSCRAPQSASTETTLPSMSSGTVSSSRSQPRATALGLSIGDARAAGRRCGCARRRTHRRRRRPRGRRRAGPRRARRRRGRRRRRRCGSGVGARVGARQGVSHGANLSFQSLRPPCCPVVRGGRAGVGTRRCARAAFDVLQRTNLAAALPPWERNCDVTLSDTPSGGRATLHGVTRQRWSSEATTVPTSSGRGACGQPGAGDVVDHVHAGGRLDLGARRQARRARAAGR